MDDLGMQAVQLEWSAAKVTVKVLMEMMKQLLENKNGNLSEVQNLGKAGLKGQNLENIEISGNEIKNLKRELQKNAVDFSVMKNSASGNYEVFFKGQSIDKIYAGLQKYVQGVTEKKRIPMKEVMRKAQERAQRRAAERKNPQQERDINVRKEKTER